MDSAAAVAGESHSIELLYRADAERLWRAVLAFSGDADVASDAVAEAYAQLIRRGPGVRDPAGWVWRVAFQLARGQLKARNRGEDELPTTQHHDRYADPDLLAALARLPDSQRAAVVLYYYADLPIGDIARRLGSNRVAVRANLSRGRRRLRELLGDHDG
jgi:RNA polymerase sigma-70 factor (ECF subfamily)